MKRSKVIINGRYVPELNISHRMTQEPFALTARAHGKLVALIGQTVDTAIKIRANADYSFQGQRNQLKAWVETDAGPVIREGVARRNALIERVQKLRADLVNVPTDKNRRRRVSAPAGDPTALPKNASWAAECADCTR